MHSLFYIGEFNVTIPIKCSKQCMSKFLIWPLTHRKCVLRSSEPGETQSLSSEKLSLFTEIGQGVSTWVHEGDLNFSALEAAQVTLLCCGALR